MQKFTLITGASSGLGEALAHLYAKENNLLLIGTNKDRLNKTKEDALNINPKNEVLTLIADLSNICDLKMVYNYTVDNGIFINNLVNCAGFGDQKAFKEMDVYFQMKMTEVNCNAPLYFCKMFLDNMIKYNEGHIINVCSIAGLYPGPYMCTYHATKAYLIYLSDAIAYEVRKTNIKVLTLCPGPFNSRFVEKAHNDYTFSKIKPLETMDVAKIAYKKSIKGKKFYIIGVNNRLTYFVSKFVPRKVLVSGSAKRLTDNRK